MHVYFCTQLSCGKAATKAQEEKIGNLLSPSNMPEVKSVEVRLEGSRRCRSCRSGAPS